MSTYRKLFGIGPVARFVPCMVNSSPHSCCTATLCNVVCTHIHINIWEIERLYNQYRSWRKRLIHRLKDAQDQGFIQERLPKCMAIEKLGVGVVLNRVEP